MTGNGISRIDQRESNTDSKKDSIGRLNTPSTSAASQTTPQTDDRKNSKLGIKSIRGDTNQWIKKPRGLGVVGQTIIDNINKDEDPVSLFEKLGTREINILNDYMNLWSRSLIELLQNLKETIPKEGMTGEVHYWRDMARLLEAIVTELREPFVEVVVQILAQVEEEAVVSDVKIFYAEKDRVVRGNKEAMWNNKYMKIIEKPVSNIERAEDLKSVQMYVAVLMKSLSNIFDTSNFYKEARMVSFLNRLLDTITAKVRKYCSLGRALREANDGSSSAKSFLT